MKKLLYNNLTQTMRLASVIALTLLFSAESWGQDCDKITQEAEVLYESGDFENTIKSLKQCQNSSDENEQWKTHRLLAMAYLATDEMDSARNSARRMLTLNPRYKPNPIKDPSDLIKLLHSIPVIPKFSFGLALSIGANTTMPNISDVYSIQETTKKYTGKNSYQLGVSTNYRFNQNFAIDISLKASSKKYEMDYSTSEWDLKMDEELTYLNLPISLRYLPKVSSKVKPFVQLGAYAGYLLSANNNFNATYKPLSEGHSQTNLSAMDRRNKMDFGILTGLGASYRKGDGQFFVQLDYFKSLRSVAKEEERYTNKQLINSFYYVDDNFKLDNLAISFGYSLYINYKVLND